MKTGEVVYGEVPAGQQQKVAPSTLTPGQRYTLFALADIGVPVTRCVFTR